MKPQQALQVLAKVTAQYRGTLQDHQQILEALKVLGEAISPQKDEPKKK